MTSGVTIGGAGGGPPRVTPSRGGDTPRKKIVGKFTKNSGETTRSDGQVKKVTPHLGGGDTRVKAKKRQ